MSDPAKAQVQTMLNTVGGPAPVFSDASVALYQGDCLDVLPGFAGGSVDVVVTDPPYLVGYRGRSRRHAAMARDDADGWWVEPAYRELFRVLRDDAFCVSFYGWPHVDVWMGAWRAAGFRPVSHLLFEKERPGLGRVTRSRHETAFVLAKGKPRVVRAIPDLLPFRRERGNPHPTPKPVAPLARLIRSLVPDGVLVLDPFAGSGGILVAARLAGCRAVGIEIEPRWCALAASRLRQGGLLTAATRAAAQLLLPFCDGEHGQPPEPSRE